MCTCCFRSCASCLCYDVLNLNFRRFNMFAVVSIGENIFRPFDTYFDALVFLLDIYQKECELSNDNRKDGEPSDDKELSFKEAQKKLQETRDELATIATSGENFRLELVEGNILHIDAKRQVADIWFDWTDEDYLLVKLENDESKW